MNTDIRLHIEFWSHAKTRRMIRTLGLQGPVSLQILWCYAAKNRPDGLLAKMDVTDIEEAAGWPAERAGEFVAYCAKSGWLDRASRGTYRIHEWVQYNPWAASSPARQEYGKLGAHKRYHLKRGTYKPDQCSYCREAIASPKAPYSQPNAPLPSPLPLPSPKRKRETDVSLSAGATLTARLREDGIRVTKAARALITDWCTSPGELAALQIYTNHRDKIRAADRPVAFLGAILRAERSPRLAAVPDRAGQMGSSATPRVTVDDVRDVQWLLGQDEWSCPYDRETARAWLGAVIDGGGTIRPDAVPITQFTRGAA